jgi:acyl-homoserine-lactone acylase
MKKLFLPVLIFFLFLTGRGQGNIDVKNIDIVRDSFGVPHIFAKTDAAVAYGLAWAQAEDDFRSMQETLLPTKGLMGSVLGKKAVAADYAFALFRCREITSEKWSTLSPEFLKLVDGFISGINQFAKTHRKEVLHKNLFPVTAQDYVSAAVFALTIFNGGDKALQRIYNNAEWELPELNKKGSNTAAVHSSRTTTGESFLLINAHQPNAGPQAFYEAHINSEEGLNVMGGLLSGGPCILHGVNENLGWAHTVNFCDRLDEYQLEMHPEGKLQYNFDGQWVDLEVKEVKLRIKGIPFNIKRKIYWSKYGATMKNKQGFFSIRLGANMKIGVLQQWYEMNKAKNFTEFYTALSRQELSMFNIMYADRYDTIFYINNALMPFRDTSAGYNWKQTLPGNTSKTLWTAFKPISALPQYVNPRSGFLFNTNHSPFLATGAEDNLRAGSFAKQDGWELYHLNRSVRFLELFPKTEKLDYGSFKNIKFDKQLPAVLQFTYRTDSMSVLDESAFPDLSPLIANFRSWDKKAETSSRGAAIFLLSFEYLKDRLAGQRPRQVTKQEAIDTYTHVKNYMQTHFGRTDITLGDLQKLVRGDKEWPVWGIPDVLSPNWTAPHKNGQLKAVGGDGLIMFVRFMKNQLPKVETVNIYGASARPGNTHYDDQVELFLQQKTKTMTLDKNIVYKNAERIYHPL